MDFITLISLGVGLSMDAFSVAICKGLAMKKITIKKMLVIGLWFGLFQALMPFLGYILGSSFSDSIASVDHWIAFGLLSLIGINMIKEAFSKEEKCDDGAIDIKTMLILAVATSIDALAAGVTFAFLKVNIFSAIGVIGVTTFLFSIAGVKVGNVFGARFKSKAELAGGIVLILLGIKIILEHTGIL